MKSVCFFSTFPRNDQNVLFKQAKTLVNVGYKVTVVFADGLPDELMDGILVTSIPAKYHLGGYKYRLFKYPRLFLKKLVEIDADVYETSDIDSLMVCLKLKRKGKKVMFRLLEEHPYTVYNKLKTPYWIKRIIVRLLSIWMGFVLKRIDKVTTVAPDIQEYLTRWGVKDVEILGNYPEYNSDHSICLEDYLNREDRVLYFGAVYSISRQEVFFDALTQCPDVHYLIAGVFGLGNYKKKLEEHAYWNKVEFIEQFPKSELVNFFKRSTISNVLRDFFQTGYPQGSYGIIKLFESMEAGLPIICSDVPVYREMMKDYQCGILVDPNNSKQIKDAIQYLIDHKEEAYYMGQNGRRAIAEKYNWTIEGTKYVNWIGDILMQNC